MVLFKGRIFLTDKAGGEASDGHPIGRLVQKRSYKQFSRPFLHCNGVIQKLIIYTKSIPLLLEMPTMVSYGIITGAAFGIMGLATLFTVQIFAALQTETPPELVGKVIAFMMAVAWVLHLITHCIYMRGKWLLCQRVF